MNGWKTWTGAAVVFAAGGLAALTEAYPECQMLKMAAIFLAGGGGGLGLVGLGHKLDRMRKGQ